MTTNQSHASGQKILDTTVTVAEEMSTPASKMSASHRPKTGEDYIESIRDGRELYLYGDRVKDVTTHRAPYAADILRNGSHPYREQPLRELKLHVLLMTSKTLT